MTKDSMSKYLDGEQLFGDNFDINQISKWFYQEEEGYANLGAKDRNKYEYGYHAINYNYGFRFLPKKNYSHVLGFGSAYGDEFKPILNNIERLTIVEPSNALREKGMSNAFATYVKPEISGTLPFKDNTFDLIICFGVLHHIPNVSKVMNEFLRCLRSKGYALVREPIISLGDWSKERPNLTRNERGIPIKVFRQIIYSSGFKIINEKKCMFPFTYRLKHFLKGSPFNSKFALFIDDFFCRLFSWNYRYHAYNLFKKLRPTAVYYVLSKP